MTDGLKDAHREAIIAVISANDRVERAVLFGSRATGTNTVASDIDIALFGNRLTLTDQARLAAALEEIPMAQSVDLVLYDSIRNQTLQDHIRRQGVEWPLRTRREVAATFREVSEFTIGGGWGRDTEFDDSVPVRVIRGTDFSRIRNGEFSGVPARYEQRSKVQRRMLKPGDILLEISGGSRTSNQSTGRSCFVTDRALAQLGKKVIPASFCRLVRVDQAVIDPRLAYYALQEMYVSGRAALYEQQSTGISNFQFEYFLDSEVFRLPPLSEQRAIAHVLGTLDYKIELNRRMNATLEAMARALFRSWFVDFEPVRAKIEGRDTGLPKDIADLFPDRLVDSELGESPEGWELTRLDSVATIRKGRSYRRRELVASDTALVTLKSFARGGGYRAEGLKPFSGVYKSEQVVRPGEVIVACTDVTQAAEVVGRSAVVGATSSFRTLVASLDVLIVRPENPSPGRAFLYYVTGTENYVAHVRARTTGTTVLHLSKDAVASFRFALPPRPLMERFGHCADSLRGRIQANTSAVGLLAELRDMLLPKLVSGELRVKGLEPASGRDDHPVLVGTHRA